MYIFEQKLKKKILPAYPKLVRVNSNRMLLCSISFYLISFFIKSFYGSSGLLPEKIKMTPLLSNFAFNAFFPFYFCECCLKLRTNLAHVLDFNLICHSLQFKTSRETSEKQQAGETFSPIYVKSTFTRLRLIFNLISMFFGILEAHYLMQTAKT